MCFDGYLYCEICAKKREEERNAKVEEDLKEMIKERGDSVKEEEPKDGLPDSKTNATTEKKKSFWKRVVGFWEDEIAKD